MIMTEMDVLIGICRALERIAACMEEQAKQNRRTEAKLDAFDEVK